MIPTTFGSDWRDLPNKVIELPNGNITAKLKYPYIDYKTNKPAVCSCATKKNAVAFYRHYIVFLCMYFTFFVFRIAMLVTGKT